MTENINTKNDAYKTDAAIIKHAFQTSKFAHLYHFQKKLQTRSNLTKHSKRKAIGYSELNQKKIIATERVIVRTRCYKSTNSSKDSICIALRLNIKCTLHMYC